jgi:BirA family biotin operon repressor/biotin-[acetyl-CoA-carboxylase] ligase
MLDEKILNALRSRPDDHVSSDELCRLACVSRAAIWKHIEKLREEGYDIEASPHLGYRLVGIPDSLIPAEIKWKLDTGILGKEIISYTKVDSTNDVAYSLAEKGAREGLVVLADEQVKGKGRLGRRWVSPPKGGIYLSVVLRPKIVPNEIPKITLVSAVAAALAMRELTGLEAMIKWPNDILINDKKVCGILTEMKAEQDSVGFVVVGIGVNVNTSAGILPKGASSLQAETPKRRAAEAISRVELARLILENLEKQYNIFKEEGFEPIAAEWKGLSAMLGSRVKVVLPNRTYEGQVRDLDGDGFLVIRRDTGILEKVSSGDIFLIKQTKHLP